MLKHCVEVIETCTLVKSEVKERWVLGVFTEMKAAVTGVCWQMIQCGLAFGTCYYLHLQGRNDNLKIEKASSPVILTFHLPACAILYQKRSIVSEMIAFLTVRFTECHHGEKVQMIARSFFVAAVTSWRCSPVMRIHWPL